jgi:acyl dehydratase
MPSSVVDCGAIVLAPQVAVTSPAYRFYRFTSPVFTGGDSQFVRSESLEPVPSSTECRTRVHPSTAWVGVNLMNTVTSH